MRKYLLVVVALMAVVVAQSFAQAENSERVFPLYKDMAGDQKLPLPFGIGLTLHRQDQGYEIVKANRLAPVGLDLSQIPGLGQIPGIEAIQSLDLSMIPGLDIDIENELLEVNAKLDMWVLPFLNVFGLVGSVEGETVVEVAATVPIPLNLTIPIDYEGVVYGAGVTLAGGWKRWFGSLTYTYTDTKLEESSSSVNAWILTPKVGLTNERGALWVGAMYQEAEEKQSGSRAVNIPMPVTIEYDVELEQKDAWNVLAGLHTTVGEHWDLELEGGFGDRKQATVSATYRF